tara:strand:+ start:380 stop:565 length:186 start_codon:yes stop_codon:yes gene_type:complete
VDSVFVSLVFQDQSLFQPRDNVHHCYRIPALLVINRRTILGFAEARQGKCNDDGDFDLAVK